MVALDPGIVPRLVVNASGLAGELELRSVPNPPSLTNGLFARSGRVANPGVAALSDCIA